MFINLKWWIQIGIFHNIDKIVYHIYKIGKVLSKDKCYVGIQNSMDIHYEKSHPSKSHYNATKTKKKLIYNYYATILWVLPLLCNYPPKNIVYY